MPNSDNRILIIANSARMLAQAARNSGLIPFVIDCYGDLDTQQLAEQFIQIHSLNIADLIPAVKFFQSQNLTQLIYGSGFECNPDSLVFLASYFKVVGNLPETFIALQDKPDFFQRLKQLNINYPEVCFSVPNDFKGWLIKPQKSQGGLSIRWAEPLALPTDFYYQRYIEGKSLSALFLADGKQAHIIGCNQQFTASFLEQPFMFTAILNHADVPLKQQQILIQWIHALTLAYGLKGLNSLDFILTDKGCYVLEINPRPPASMQLYDENLLAAHIHASQKKLKKHFFEKTNYRIYYICYATKEIIIPKSIKWPDWATDLPMPDSRIAINSPICGIIAEANDSADVLNQLQHKKNMLFSLLS